MILSILFVCILIGLLVLLFSETFGDWFRYSFRGRRTAVALTNVLLSIVGIWIVSVGIGLTFSQGVWMWIGLFVYELKVTRL